MSYLSIDLLLEKAISYRTIMKGKIQFAAEKGRIQIGEKSSGIIFQFSQQRKVSSTKHFRHQLANLPSHNREDTFKLNKHRVQ